MTYQPAAHRCTEVSLRCPPQTQGTQITPTPQTQTSTTAPCPHQYSAPVTICGVTATKQIE